jgi:hypothetical protein
VPWKLTVRSGPRIERSHYDRLEEALDAAEAKAKALSRQVPSRTDTVDVKFKRFEPIQQVAARIELSGPERLLPKVHAGVDVRGDGSTEAYLGRIRREVVDQRNGETAYRALRRALATHIER